MELQKVLPRVIAIGEEAAAFIKSHFEKVSDDQVEAKEQNSLVSFVDKTAEEMIVAGLSKILPDAGFVTEEDTPDDENHEYIWVIDPLDGTTNFLQGLPHFSVSIALQKGSEIVLGVVVDIMQNDTYSATLNGGAYRNGQRISVSQKSDISEAVLATGFPYDKKARGEVLKNILTGFLSEVRAIRRFGSAALDMTYVACGRLDGYYETSLNRWDIAAGIILVREAGGFVSNFEGDEYDYSGKKLLTSNQHLKSEMLAVIKKAELL